MSKFLTMMTGQLRVTAAQFMSLLTPLMGFGFVVYTLSLEDALRKTKFQNVFTRRRRATTFFRRH